MGAQEPLRTAQAIRVEQAPKLDGTLDDPLWRAPNCVVTPHTGNTLEMARKPLSARITENVRRFAAGEPLIGPVDPVLGY